MAILGWGRMRPFAVASSVARRRRPPLGRSVVLSGLVLALASALVAPASAATLASGAKVRNSGWMSANWAGYIVQHGPYTSVTGQWTVPGVSTSQSGFSAVWLGVDGVTNDHLIQVGTEQDSLFGDTSYSAWWEILPAPAVEITSFHVHPGDRITASITRVSATRWQIRIVDAGHGSYTTTRTYIGRGTSAEWILEAPVVNDRQSRLAQHGPVVFDHATANGHNPNLSTSQSGTLVQFHRQVAITSAPDAQRDGFTVTRV